MFEACFLITKVPGLVKSSDQTAFVMLLDNLWHRQDGSESFLDLSTAFNTINHNIPWINPGDWVWTAQCCAGSSSFSRVDSSQQKLWRRDPAPGTPTLCDATRDNAVFFPI